MGTLKTIPRIVWLAALGSAAIGTGVETAAHQLLNARGAAWLIKPYIYAGLPKPFVHINWIRVSASVLIAVVAIAALLVVRRPPSRPARFIWPALGLILGGSFGDAALEMALGTTTNIFVITRPGRGFAFSPYLVAVYIGAILTLPQVLAIFQLALRLDIDDARRNIREERRQTASRKTRKPHR